MGCRPPRISHDCANLGTVTNARIDDLAAFAVALGIMLGVFGQVPVSDFLIGTTASKISRSRALVPDIWSAFLPFPVLCH